MMAVFVEYWLYCIVKTVSRTLAQANMLRIGWHSTRVVCAVACGQTTRMRLDTSLAVSHQAMSWETAKRM